MTRWHLTLGLLVLAWPRCAAAGVHQGAAQTAALPHVDSCSFCEKCHYTNDRNASARPTASRALAWPAGAEEGTPWHEQVAAAALSAVPTPEQWAAKIKKPHCVECWGCSTQLQPLRGMQHAFGHEFVIEAGASPEWLFLADLDDTHETGRKAVVKIFCMPLDKVTRLFNSRCPLRDRSVRAAQHLLALDRLAYDCGMTDINVRVWVAPVNAVVPRAGVHVFWAGVFMERAPGISLNQLISLAHKVQVQELTIKLLQDKLNKTQVTRAAMFDLLTAQCDRHAENVFIDKSGDIKLIDNLSSLRFSKGHCMGQDSIFLPGTQKNEIVRFGVALVAKRRGARARRDLNPLVVMDHRCWVDGGEIGTRYPPELLKCLRGMSSMNATQLMQAYGFPALLSTQMLLERTTNMLTRGFEWTLRHGQPLNRPGLRYKWHTPCCQLKLSARHWVVCAHPWEAAAHLPWGNPHTGLAWVHTYPDPGTFNGSTLWADTGAGDSGPGADGAHRPVGAGAGGPGANGAATLGVMRGNNEHTL